MKSLKGPGVSSTTKSRRSRVVVPVEQPKATGRMNVRAVTKAVPHTRMSALDAAAEVLGRLASKEASIGLGAKDLIERMEKTGLWTSPGGKTPAATLYSALIREIKERKSDSRFKRISAGKFSLAASGPAARKQRTNSLKESVE